LTNIYANILKNKKNEGVNQHNQMRFIEKRPHFKIKTISFFSFIVCGLTMASRHCSGTGLQKNMDATFF